MLMLIIQKQRAQPVRIKVIIYPGTTLQFFDDSDDLEIAKQEIVQQDNGS